MSSTACSSWEARTPSASPEPQPELGSTRLFRRPMQQRPASPQSFIQCQRCYVGHLPATRSSIGASADRSAAGDNPDMLLLLSDCLNSQVRTESLTRIVSAMSWAGFHWKTCASAWWSGRSQAT